jgi:hypothetical protein
MAADEILRLHYYERQYLGAADLEDQQAYLRDMRRRHNIGPHTWGILVGLMMVEEPVAGDPTAVDVYIQPGMAIDGFGREIIVMAPIKLDPLLFESFANQQHRAVWISYDQELVSQAKGGYAQCNSTNQFGRIQETYKIVIAPTNPTHLDVMVDGKSEAPGSADLPIPADDSIPFQEFPDDNNQPEWLIQLGWANWDGVNSKFIPTNPATRLTDDRSYVGAVAASIYGPVPFPKTIDPASDAPRFFIQPRFPLTDPDSAAFAEVVGRLQVDGRIDAVKDVWIHGNKLQFKDTGGGDSSVPLWMERTAGPSGTGTDLRIHIGDDPADDTSRLSIGPADPKGSTTEKTVLAVRASNNVDIPTGTLNFGASLGQKINLWADQYAIGIQPGTQYYRTAGEFCWYFGGKFSPSQADPGPGGSLLMSLDNGGSLSVTKDLNLTGDINFGTVTRQMLNLWNVNYGIGIQDSTLYNRTEFDFCWYRRGAHSNARGNPGGGALAMKLDSGSNLSVSGDVNVAGNLNVSGNVNFAPGAAQNLIRVEHFTLAVSMGGSTTPRPWSQNYPAFTQIYAVYAVLQGFSIYGNGGDPSFSTWGHDANADAIPQHVFVRVDAHSSTQASGVCFCSESKESQEGDNTVLFTLIVMGRP